MKRSTLGLFLCCLLFVSAYGNTSRVFVTSTTTTGNMGSIAGIDQICATRASAAGLIGTWRAWISITGTMAQSRVPGTTGPYRLLDGTVVASDGFQLESATHLHGIDMNEFGATVPPSPVWTGSSVQGLYFSPSCNNWTTALAPATGIAGATDLTNQGWTVNSSLPCGTQARLYCFQNASALISGRVISAAGRPIAHARVVISGSSLASPREVYTGRYGKYAFDDLLTQVNYTITVSQRRYTFSPSSRVINSPQSDVTDANFTSN